MSYNPPGSDYQGYPPPNYPPSYAGYQQYYPGPMARSTNPWAIASLICSIVGISILGVIFGHIAMSEIKRSNGWQDGHGMALAGLIIGYIEIGVSLLVFILIVGFVRSAPHMR